MKKILGITASAQKKGGETEKALDFALKFFDNQKFEIDQFSLSKLNISFCTACNFCNQNLGQCCIKDDVANLNQKMREADAIIFASPVYFGCISAQLKAIFDRTLPLRRDNFALRDKICSGIAVGRSRNGGQELVLSQIQTFANIHGMIYVGDDSHFGGTVAADFDTDEFGQSTIEGLARKIIRLLGARD